jgi:type III pantothenate kinase
VNKNQVFVIIDNGNTALKYAIYRNEHVVFGNSMEKLLEATESEGINAGLISNVGNPEFTSKIQGIIPSIHVLSENSKIPITNLYETPKTLGRDRLANAVAIAYLAQGQPALSIDIGTCLKFDLVNNQCAYLGGSIAPGLEMRFSAMHHFTANLPEIKTFTESELIGRDTVGSLVAGAYEGMKNEINEGIRRYLERYENLNIYLTGGDAHRFENAIKYRIFADPNLTLRGLKIIFEAND